MPWPSQFPVQVASVTLTSAQVLACFTTPVTIVPQPGAGLALWPLNGFASYTFISAAYTDHGGDLVVAWASNFTAVDCGVSLGFWDQTSSQVMYGRTLSRTSIALQANSALRIRNTTANPTGGDGTVTVTVPYLVVPVS